MNIYAVAVYGINTEINEVEYGKSNNDNTGLVVIDILEDEDDIDTVKDIIERRYGNITIESVSSYYNDGDFIISEPIKIDVR